MHILIVDQCSGSKDYPETSAVYTADEIDKHGLEDLRSREESATKKARSLYAGRQQRYVDEAVDSLRSAGHEVDRYFVSAGFGLVGEKEQLPPYEVTFGEMSSEQIETRSECLRLDEDIQKAVTSTPQFDIVFFALGSDYYQAIDLESILSVIDEETITVVFNREELADEFEQVISIPARTDDAKKHGTIVVALKGVYLQNFADHLSNGKEIDSYSDVEKYCKTEYTTQTGFDEFA